MAFYSLNSAPLEGSDRVNNFAPSQTIRPYVVWAVLHSILPVIRIYRTTAYFSPSLKNQLDWDKRQALNVAHAQTWVIQRLHSSLFRHRLNKGGLANICNIHKTGDLESGVSSMAVGGNSLSRNLWKIPFEDNRTWQLSALVVKSVGRKAWLAMSDPRQAVLAKALAKPFSTLGIINAEKALCPAAAWEELIGKHGYCPNFIPGLFSSMHSLN